MKTRLFSFVSVVCLLLCLQAQGQTYFNYAFGGLNIPATNPSFSIIRTVDPQRAIAYYVVGGATHFLSRVGMDAYVYEAKLGGNIKVNDIRVVGDDVFFCGQNTATQRAIIGHATVSDIEGANLHIKCFEVEPLPLPLTRTSSTMKRLAAYIDATGKFRIVAIGEFIYSSLSTGLPSWLSCPNISGCRAYFAVEYTYLGGVWTPINGKFLCDNSRYEHADDVVVTDNWVAIVSTYPTRDEMIIHRCDRNNVLNSFDNYFGYVVPYQEGIYTCCHMKGDTIAMVARYSTLGTAPYEARMRTVDLATMTMTSSQSYVLLYKTDPIEIVYLPNNATLVMLMQQMFPSSVSHYAFVYWKPYIPSSYVADVIYDYNDYLFNSVDRLTPKHIVAAGGDYWAEKDVSFNDPTSTCYVIAQQQISQLNVLSYVESNYNYYSNKPSKNDINEREVYNSTPMRIPCITY